MAISSESHEIEDRVDFGPLMVVLGDSSLEGSQSYVNPWSEYVLSGQVTDATLDFRAAQRALAELAGTKELEDPDVAARFTGLQYAASGNNNALFELLGKGARRHKKNGEEDEDTDSEDAEDQAINMFDAFGIFSQGACEGQDRSAFYLERGESSFAAKSLCHICVVRRECLELGMATEHGILGGLSARQRNKVKEAIEEAGAEAGDALIQEFWRKDADRIDRQIKEKEAKGIDWRKAQSKRPATSAAKTPML